MSKRIRKEKDKKIKQHKRACFDCGTTGTAAAGCYPAVCETVGSPV